MTTLPPPDALSTPNINIAALQARTTLPEKGQPFFYEKIGVVASHSRSYACVKDTEYLTREISLSGKKPTYFVEWGADGNVSDDGKSWNMVMRSILNNEKAVELNLVPGIMDDPTKLMDLVDQLSEIDVRFLRSGVGSQGKTQVLEPV